MKYNKQMVFDYINGEDIEGYDLETLENDPLFMIDVLKYSRDKKMYEFCSEQAKDNYQLVKFIVDNFKNDTKFIELVANRYIEKFDDVSSFELCILLAQITNDLFYKIKAQVRVEEELISINMFLHKETDPKLKKDLGLGFIIILDNFSFSKVIMDYFANTFINKIFYTDDLEKTLHKKHHKYEEIEKIGINKYLLNYIYNYDESLSSYIECHLDLLEDVKHEFSKIKNNWDLYLYNLNQRRVDIVYQETYNYNEENNPSSIITTFEYIYYAVKELHLENEYAEFEEIESFVKNDLQKVPGISPLEIIKKDISYLRCYNHVLNLIKNLYKYDVIEDDINYNESQKKARILNIDLKKESNN